MRPPTKYGFLIASVALGFPFTSSPMVCMLTIEYARAVLKPISSIEIVVQSESLQRSSWVLTKFCPTLANPATRRRRTTGQQEK